MRTANCQKINFYAFTYYTQLFYKVYNYKFILQLFKVLTCLSVHNTRLIHGGILDLVFDT